MKKVIAKRMDIAFYMKLYPLKMHKDAYWKSKTVICNGSLQFLEENFEKKSIPKLDCPTKEIDGNIKLAEKYAITGTPTMVLPDGSVFEGWTEADKLVKLIDDAFANAKKSK